MDWLITILGIIALIVLHEAGHFAAAKAVGMRVERFSLFFPPSIVKLRRGETEYAIGAIPLGGYVKIAGMSPVELQYADLREAEGAYYMKAPWRRIVVILAGPAVNIAIAFVLFGAVLLSSGLASGKETLVNLNPGLHVLGAPSTEVGAVIEGYPAAGVLHPGDRILTIDGRRASVSATERVVAADRCAGGLLDGCRGAKRVQLTIRRDGRTLPVAIVPRYSARAHRMLIGIDFAPRVKSFGPLAAAGGSISSMWKATEETVAGLGRAVASSKERSHLKSIVGITQVTEEAVASGPGRALVVLGYVSLVLGVLNLFPFLPLDGGHIVWSLAEKLRGRRVSMATMWRVSSVGLLLMAFLVVNGFSNDISRLLG
ncbi:MAG: M50 family metallopeptidase [Solirubrobacteraceae bacterium]